MKSIATHAFKEDITFNRSQLLEETIEKVNALDASTLGSGSNQKSKLGSALDKLNDDQVEVGKADVFRITDNSFYKQQFEIPVDLSPVFKQYDFLYTEFPVGLKTRSKWSFNKYRLLIEFEDDNIKVIDIFPSDKFKEIAKVQGNLNVGIDTSLNFKAVTPEIKIQKGVATLEANAAVGANESGGIKFIVPPFEYSIKKWEIKTEGKDLNYLDWEFYSIDEEMKSESRKLKAIIRIPKNIKSANYTTTLVAYRNPDSFKDALTGIFTNFSDTLQSWFSKGVPIPFTSNHQNLLSNNQGEI
ncbi:MAG: hypothetical protein JST21_07260 [Bacteroidetes bacterium]|nr:hypothetical protein [Bacteroidota bacterium]